MKPNALNVENMGTWQEIVDPTSNASNVKNMVTYNEIVVPSEMFKKME